MEGFMERADCIFCKIARGDLHAEKPYQDEQVIAFEDAHPQAPLHFLVSTCIF
jgi:histidine triad (HIT) family protein